MPPTLIVDGYNLIRASPVLSRIDQENLEEGREALISRLADYRKVRHFPVIVVFDGTGFYHLSTEKETRMGIKILYSPAGRTADELIVSLARQKGREYVVVTSDHGIWDRLKDTNCVCVDSKTFDSKIDNALYELFKGTSLEEEEGEALLPSRARGKRRKLPKKLRRQRDILRRL